MGDGAMPNVVPAAVRARGAPERPKQRSRSRPRRRHRAFGFGSSVRSPPTFGGEVAAGLVDGEPALAGGDPQIAFDAALLLAKSMRRDPAHLVAARACPRAVTVRGPQRVSRHGESSAGVGRCTPAWGSMLPNDRGATNCRGGGGAAAAWSDARLRRSELPSRFCGATDPGRLPHASSPASGRAAVAVMQSTLKENVMRLALPPLRAMRRTDSALALASAFGLGCTQARAATTIPVIAATTVDFQAQTLTLYGINFLDTDPVKNPTGVTLGNYAVPLSIVGTPTNTAITLALPSTPLVAPGA
jgi:hypothetical protein